MPETTQLIGMEAVVGAATINDARVLLAYSQVEYAIKNYENVVILVMNEKEKINKYIDSITKLNKDLN